MAQLLQNALYGTALILTAALLRRILAHRLIPEARLVLWALCLLRLLAPAAPGSALSLWGLLAGPAPQPAQTPQVSSPVQTVPAAPAPAPQPAAPAFPWEMVLAAVWLAGGLALALRYILSWRRTRRAVECAIPIPRPDPRYFPLPKCARLREGVVDGAPLTFGAVKPTVVLPPGLSGVELDCVLAHEGVHAARRDNLWHYAMALALAVHWWNPAVWLMSRLLRRDIELACDRAAVNRLGADRRADYARALVSLATQGEGAPFSHTFGRKLTEERILSVMKFKKTTILGAVLSLALVLAVTVALAAGPAKPTPAPSPTDSAGKPSGPAGIRVKITDTPLPDEASDRIADLLCRIDGEEFNGEPASSPEHSSCPHLHYRDAGVAYSFRSATEAAHTKIQVFLEWCFDCEDSFVTSVKRTEEPHSFTFARAGEDDNPAFGGGSYVEGDHSAPDPSQHHFIFSHTCSDCLYSCQYTVNAGCSEDGCVDIQSVTTDIQPVTAESPVRTSSGTYAPCQAEDCAVPYDHFHLDGKVVRIYRENPGLLCTRSSCDKTGPHTHDGVQFVDKAPEAYTILHPELEPVPSAAP